MCNLGCEYCFFLSKEMLYPGSRFRMFDKMLGSYLRQLVEARVGAPVVEVAWQGGEPTLMGGPSIEMPTSTSCSRKKAAPTAHGSTPSGPSVLPRRGRVWIVYTAL